MTFEKLNDFLNRLIASKTPYRIRKIRDSAILVEVFAPSEHWEVEFVESGEMEIERYRSNGSIDDESALPRLWELVADAEDGAE
jgi:hypothetical protein